MGWLQIGSRGDAVKEPQEKLLAKGINPGTADGIFGSKTAEAVRRYQEQNGLQVDGIAGPETFKSLGMMESPKAKEAATRRPREPSAEETARAKVKAAKAKLDERAEAEADAKAAATKASSVDALRNAEQSADKAAAGKTAAEAETRIGGGLEAVKQAAAKADEKEAPKGFKAKLEAMREAVRARKSRDR